MIFFLIAFGFERRFCTATIERLICRHDSTALALINTCIPAFWTGPLSGMEPLISVPESYLAYGLGIESEWHGVLYASELFHSAVIAPSQMIIYGLAPIKHART